MSNIFQNDISQTINRKKSATIKNKILSSSSKDSRQPNTNSKPKSIFKKLKFTSGLLVDLLKKPKKSATTNSLFKKSNKSMAVKKSNSLFKYNNIPGIQKLHHLTQANIDNLLTDKNEQLIIENSIYHFQNISERKNIKPNIHYINSSYILTESNSNSSNKKFYVTNININKNVNKNVNNNIYNNEDKGCVWESRKLRRNVIFSYLNDINYTYNKNCKISEKKIVKPSVKSLLIKKKNFGINPNDLLNFENKKLKVFLKENNIPQTNRKNIEPIKTEENKNNGTNNFYSVFNKIKRVKRSSQIDRLLFKIENPEECFEEFVDKEKPGDKYLAFRNQILRHRNKIDKMILEVKLNHNKCEEAVKKNSLESINRKYIVKTLYNL